MPAPPLVPGSVTAPGERAVVLGDGTEGDIDTGDQPGGTQAMTGRRRRKTYPLQSAEATELPPHATVASGDRSIAIDTWGRPFNGIANTGDDAAFVGRAQELTLLDTAPGGTGTTVVHGLGCAGKSALAAHWAATRSHTDNPTWWINAKTAPPR